MAALAVAACSSTVSSVVRMDRSFLANVAMIMVAVLLLANKSAQHYNTDSCRIAGAQSATIGGNQATKQTTAYPPAD